jgi:hypothetical protein
VRQRQPRPASAPACSNQAHIRAGVMGARQGRVGTNAVRAPVRPATRWIQVVSRASARVVADIMVVNRRASLDCPTPCGPRSSRLWPERLHHVQLY